MFGIAKGGRRAERDNDRMATAVQRASGRTLARWRCAWRWLYC